MSEQRDIEERLEHYAKLAMPSYPNDLCSEAKREIARLRGELERFGAMYDKADKEAADEIASLRLWQRAALESRALENAEIASLRAQLVNAQHENAVLRDVLMNPDPDQEPDNVRLHREKCDALDRALKAEAQLASARKAAIEECAKIAERFAGANAVSEPYTSYIQGRAEGAQAVAAHIRAAALTDDLRGEK